MWALQEIGPDVVPLLRDVRRSRTAGRLRQPALEALAAVAGPAALDERDRSLLRRLIRIKLVDEVPEPMHLCGAWFALPTGDQAAVLDAFGLSDPEPVTMRLGASAWNHDHHDWGGPGNEHRCCSRVYVTPRLDGWTLVFGQPFDGTDHTDTAETPEAWQGYAGTLQEAEPQVRERALVWDGRRLVVGVGSRARVAERLFGAMSGSGAYGE